MFNNSCVNHNKNSDICYKNYIDTGYCLEQTGNFYIENLNYNKLFLSLNNKNYLSWFNNYWQKYYQNFLLSKLGLFLNSYASMNFTNQYNLVSIITKQYDQWRYENFTQQMSQKGYNEEEKVLLHLAFLMQEQKYLIKADKIYEKLLQNNHISTTQGLKKIIELQKSYSKQNNSFLQIISKPKKEILLSSKKLENQAYNLSKKNKTLEASEQYLRFSQKATRTKDKSKGCFLSSFLLYEANLYSLSQLRFAACNDVLKYSKYQEESLWYQAFMFIITKNYQASLVSLQKLNFYPSTQKDKYDYFKAFVFTKLKEPQKAQRILKNLINKPKINYYTVLAHKALQHQPHDKIIKEHKKSATPHENIVDTVSNKYNVNKSLLYAIMQAESRFITSAISHKGAKGLMQVMPFVAKDLALKANIKNFSESKLYEPKTNIKIAGLIIADLQQKFNKPYLSIAAYNAGSYRVKKWLNSFGDLSEELFIERIPFKQTREYVKKVIPNELIYNTLLNKSLITS